MPVRLEQSLVAVFAGVIVRAGYEVEAHGLEVGRHVGCAGEPTRARACERPAVDDVALVVAGGDVRVADQADHVLKGGCGVLRLRIRDDDVSDRRNGEAVGDRCGELEVIPGLAITGARLLGRHGFPAQNGRRQRHEHKGYKLVALHHGSSPGERFLHVGPSGPIGDNPVMPYRNLERGRGRWGQIGAVAIVVATGVTIAAQQTPPPNPLSQPLLDAAGVLRDDAFIRIPLRPDDRRYAGIDGARMKAQLLDVDAISLADRDTGNLFWGRNVGTAGHVATQAWVERHFRRNGLENVHRQDFDLLPQWNLEAWDITFASGRETFSLASARPPQDAASTPEGGHTFELVWIGGGSDADYLGRDVTGKAVLIQDIPRPGTLRHSIRDEDSVARAFEKAAAAVGIVYGISDNFAVWQRTGDRPGFNLGYDDGMRLRDRLGRGERVTVTVSVESQMVSGLRAASVWGTLPGASDEEILIIAHMDGYFRSASDNASGLAVMVGLLEHFKQVPRAERRRTIRFLGSVGHHGGPGTSWLHDNRETALADTVLAINLEHVAVVRTKYWGTRLRMMNAVSPMRWWVHGSPALLDVVLDAFNRFNVGITADMEPGASGEMGRMARDVPSMQVITSPEIKHTEQDTPEWVPAVGLEQVARAYAKIIDGVNTLDRPALQPATGSN